MIGETPLMHCNGLLSITANLHCIFFSSFNGQVLVCWIPSEPYQHKLRTPLRKATRGSVSKNIGKFRKVVRGDRKEKGSEQMNVDYISKGFVVHITHEFLKIKKICSGWVSRFLNIDWKVKRFQLSKYVMALICGNTVAL